MNFIHQIGMIFIVIVFLLILKPSTIEILFYYYLFSTSINILENEIENNECGQIHNCLINLAMPSIFHVLILK